MRCRLLSIVLALLAAGLLLACAAQRPKDAADVEAKEGKIVVVAVTSEPGLNDMGRISGKVVDASNAAICGATIAVINAEGVLASGAATDLQGEFVTSPLPPLTYTIVIEGQCFYTKKANNIPIEAGLNTRLQCVLVQDRNADCLMIDDSEPPLISWESTATGAVISEGRNGQIYVDPY
jgi:hypothetical protein